MPYMECLSSEVDHRHIPCDFSDHESFDRIAQRLLSRASDSHCTNRDGFSILYVS